MNAVRTVPVASRPFFCADGYQNKKWLRLKHLTEGISVDSHHKIPLDPIVLSRQKMKQR